MKIYCLLPLFLFIHSSISAQTGDSTNKPLPFQDTARNIVKKDTGIAKKDSVIKRNDSVKPVFQKPGMDDTIKKLAGVIDSSGIDTASSGVNFSDSLYQDSLKQVQATTPQKPVAKKRPPVLSEQIPKNSENKNWLFYYLTGILIFLGLLKQVYNVYFKDLFRYFFRTSLKQSQIQEKLIQSELPSFLLNIFFIIVFGTFLFLLRSFAKIEFELQSWQVLLICIGGVGILYLLKFFLLRLMGWLFGLRKSAGTYTFTVFMVNKVLGIALTPLLVILAFTSGNLYEIGLTVSITLTILLFLYRFLRSYSPVKQDISVNRFHFFVYLCAFEVVPLLLIYKTLLLVL